MANPTEVVRAVVLDNEYLTSIINNANVRLESASIQDIGAPIINDPLARNTFINTLYNKFIKTQVLNGLFKNPLEPLKGEKLPLFGDTVERMIFNPAKAIAYDSEEDNILTTQKPDIKVEYIRVERKDKYAITIPFPVMKQAFSNDNSFSQFLSGAYNSLYNGDAIDEFNLMKKIFSDSMEGGYLPALTLEDNSTAITKQIINYSKNFRFPSSSFNAYSAHFPGENPLQTWCSPENLVLVCRSDLMTDIQIDVLAAAYQLDEVKLINNIIEVDAFPDENLMGCLCDRSFVQVEDSVMELDSFHRADDLSEKTYWHHWQTMTFSLLCNAVAFTQNTVEPTPPGTGGE